MAHVMIVDDDEDFALAAATVLRDAGHAVEIETKIDHAVAAMEGRRPDLVILDVMFPQGSSAGFEFARSMRHDHETLRGIPILMLTAVGQKFPFGFGPTDIDGESLPVDDFLEKPVDLDVLCEKVAGLVGGGPAGKPSQGEPPRQP